MPFIQLSNGENVEVSEPSSDHGVSRRIWTAEQAGEHAKVKDTDGDNQYVNPKHVIRVYG